MSWSIFETNLQLNAWYLPKNQYQLTVDEVTTSSFVTFDWRQQVHEKEKITSYWSYSKSLHCQPQSCFYSIIRWSYRINSFVSIIPHTHGRDLLSFQSLLRIDEQNIHAELFKVHYAHVLEKYLYLWDFKQYGHPWSGKWIW